MCNYKLIYPLCLYIKITPEVPTIPLRPLMPTNNDKDTTHVDEFHEPIQYMNDSPNNNPMTFTTGVYNHKIISYKHPYTLFLPPITPHYTSSGFAHRKYCLFFVNLTFASID